METLCKVMTKLRAHVEEKIKGMLVNLFEMVFDGGSCGSIHRVTVFTFFKCNNDRGHEHVMLSLSTFTDETRYMAQEHKLFLKHILYTYGKSLAIVIAFICRNVFVKNVSPVISSSS